MAGKPSQAMQEIIQVWGYARSIESHPGPALDLLADAIAFGLNEGDYHPQQILDRIQETFDRLHIAKHIGRRH